MQPCWAEDISLKTIVYISQFYILKFTFSSYYCWISYVHWVILLHFYNYLYFCAT